MNILAIDLGDTTGYTYVNASNDTGEPTLKAHGSFVLEQGLVGVDLYRPDLVIIERPAIARNPFQQEMYSAAVSQLQNWYAERVKMVRPTDWKQRFKKHPLPGRGVLETQHERDAWRIAAWAIDKFDRPNRRTFV
jgi:hypothetical protein